MEETASLDKAGRSPGSEWSGLSIDPLARLGERVELEAPSSVGSGAVLEGPLRAGPGFRVHPRALVGGPAQHRAGNAGRLLIGRNVEVRECATLHRGSPAGTGTTWVGDGVLIMAYAHVGHDAEIGDRAVLSNGVQVGGHVQIGSDAVLGARAAIHQFVRIGRGAMVAAGSMVSGDVPPWTLVAGDRARIVGPNSVALRAHCPASSAVLIRRALRLAVPPIGQPAVPPGELMAKMPDPARAADDPALAELVAFLEGPSRRSLCGRTRG